MRKTKVLALTVVLFALAGSVPSALAADFNSPSLLVLENVTAEGLEGTLEGRATDFLALSGNSITAANSSLKIAKKNCELIAGFPSDTRLCKDVAFTLTGVKKEAVPCRSENSRGEKDPIETVLSLLDLHMADEESLEEGREMVLQPLLLIKWLGIALENELRIRCGIVVTIVRGVVGCLMLPGLAPTKLFEVLCKTNTDNDPVTGHCEQECSLLESEPEQIESGKGFEDAWLVTHLEGKLNANAFIDD